MWKCNILCWQLLGWKCVGDSIWLHRRASRLAALNMNESSPANQALIAYVIGIILLLAFSILIGTMVKGESEKHALILLNPVIITSPVLNTGDSPLCKKPWRGSFCPSISMAPAHPDLQWTTLCPSIPKGCEKPLLTPTSSPSQSLQVNGAEWSRLWSHPMRPPVGCDAKRVRNLIRVVLVHRFQTMNRVHWGCRSLVGSGKGCSSGRLWGYTLLHNNEQ